MVVKKYISGLKMSSLPCKYVFYRPEYYEKRDTTEFSFEALEMQKQIHELVELIYDHIGVINLIIMFTLIVMVIKMLNIAHSCIFCQ